MMKYFRSRTIGLNVKWQYISQLKVGKIREYSPIFKHAYCEKDLKDNRHNSLHLALNYVRMFVLGHNPFLEAHSFPLSYLLRKLFASRNR